MKIYFCEKCGVSIPLQEVVGGRATARNGKTYCQACQPDASGGDLKLYFCDNCRVSIPLQDVITNRAKTVGERMFCVDCGRLTDPQRDARRARIQKEMREKEESRYRLHFCDSCNTSIPQSHLITGRAVMRGGRTFCERCRARAEGPRVSALGAVGVLLLLGVVFVAGYVVLGAGGDLFAGEREAADAGPDPVEVLTKQVTGMEETLRGLRDDRAREVGELRDVIPALEEAQGRLRQQVAANRGESGDLRKEVGSLRQEMEERLKRIDDSMRKLEERFVALTARLEELKEAAASAPAARPAPVEPPEPAAEPAAEPVPAGPKPAPKLEDAPARVQALVKDLQNDDAGVRFSAAVELGKTGHKAAVAPLVEILKEDRDVFVRRAATRSLGELSAWRAVPALIEALEDKEFFVAITAHKALETITGQDFGFKEGLSRSELRRVVQKAEDWWEDHEGDRAD